MRPMLLDTEFVTRHYRTPLRAHPQPHRQTRTIATMSQTQHHENPPVWTTRGLLTWTTKYFDKNGLDNPRLAAEMLLAHVIGVQRLQLYTDRDRPAHDLERAMFRNLVERAAAHEPVDYLVGYAPFFSLQLKVDATVLIPRPSTETLVEHVIQHARRSPEFHAPVVADIGTGSGAIAVALARHVPNCRVVATDVSPDALKVAAANADALDVADRIEFRAGDLFAPLKTEKFRYVISNPPYISEDEWSRVPANVREYEPPLALRGGLDGLQFVRPLIKSARDHLEHPGQLVIEIADSQKMAALQLADNATGLANPHVIADHEGLPRTLIANSV